MIARHLPAYLACAALLLAGCGRAPSTSLDPFDAAGAEDGFAALDMNGDGRLSRSEAALPGQAFDQVDADRDGVLTFFEWSARRDDGSTAWGIQLQREGVRDTADGLRTGTAIPTGRGASATSRP